MIADRVYEELKKMKGTDKSFSEVILESLEVSKAGRKTGEGLKEIAGILEGDAEYDEVIKWSKKMWKKSDEKIWKMLR